MRQQHHEPPPRDLHAFEIMRRMQRHEDEQASIREVAETSISDKCFNVDLGANDNVTALLNKCVKAIRGKVFNKLKEELVKTGFEVKVRRRGETNWEMEATSTRGSICVTYKTFANNLIGMSYSIVTTSPRRRVKRQLTTIGALMKHIKETMADGTKDRTGAQDEKLTDAAGSQ